VGGAPAIEVLAGGTFDRAGGLHLGDLASDIGLLGHQLGQRADPLAAGGEPHPRLVDAEFRAALVGQLQVNRLVQHDESGRPAGIGHAEVGGQIGRGPVAALPGHAAELEADLRALPARQLRGDLRRQRADIVVWLGFFVRATTPAHDDGESNAHPSHSATHAAEGSRTVTYPIGGTTPH
jgi:hypothetical protein